MGEVYRSRRAATRSRGGATAPAGDRASGGGLTAWDIERIGYGELHLSPDAFETCDPQWFRLALEGKRKAENQRERNAWNRTRWMTAALLSQNSKRPIQPTDLFEWPDETAARVKRIKDTADRMNADKRFPKTYTK